MITKSSSLYLQISIRLHLISNPNKKFCRSSFVYIVYSCVDCVGNFFVMLVLGIFVQLDVYNCNCIYLIELLRFNHHFRMRTSPIIFFNIYFIVIK